MIGDGGRQVRTREWGDCAACAHAWAEHLPPEPCSECVYELDHGELRTTAGLCWAAPPAYPNGRPDPRLDAYRGGYARVFDGMDNRGHLATRVQTWCTQTGPWWKRRWTDPRELPQWLWVAADGSLVTDGVVSEESLDEELADWEQGRFGYMDGYLRLEWRVGPEAEAGRRRHFTIY